MEDIALAECAQEAVFTRMLIFKLTGETKTALIYGNNIELLFLSGNRQVSQRTKHIDILHHYLR